MSGSAPILTSWLRSITYSRTRDASDNQAPCAACRRGRHDSNFVSNQDEAQDDDQDSLFGEIVSSREHRSVTAQSEDGEIRRKLR